LSVIPTFVREVELTQSSFIPAHQIKHRTVDITNILSLIYTKKLKTYPQPMNHFATRFVKQIRANLKPKKTNERHSQQCFPPLLTFSRISAYTALVY